MPDRGAMSSSQMKSLSRGQERTCARAAAQNEPISVHPP